MELNEYEETKQDTMEQLKELNESLEKMISGNMTLVNELGAMQLAAQAAISAAFKTPNVIQFFGKREPKQLRERLLEIERDVKLGKLGQEDSERQKYEILSTLRTLGDTLNDTEIELIEKYSASTIDTTDFVRVGDYSADGQLALAIASQQVRDTQNT